MLVVFVLVHSGQQVKFGTHLVISTFILANGIIVCYKETGPNENHAFNPSVLGAMTSPP
jgi:hypothetical protein